MIKYQTTHYAQSQKVYRVYINESYIWGRSVWHLKQLLRELKFMKLQPGQSQSTRITKVELTKESKHLHTTITTVVVLVSVSGSSGVLGLDTTALEALVAAGKAVGIALWARPVWNVILTSSVKGIRFF